LACLICEKRAFIVGPRKHSQLLSRNRYQCALFNVHSKSQSSKQSGGTGPNTKPFISPPHPHNKDVLAGHEARRKVSDLREGRSNLESKTKKRKGKGHT